MYMTDAEIRDSCRNAIPGKDHARVLADLNGCPLEEMRAKLRTLGLTGRQARPESKKATKRPLEKGQKEDTTQRETHRHPWTLAPPPKREQSKTTWRHKQARELYRDGATDGEIAESIGVARTTVRRWRQQSNLPPNMRKGAKK